MVRVGEETRETLIFPFGFIYFSVVKMKYLLLANIYS